MPRDDLFQFGSQFARFQLASGEEFLRKARAGYEQAVRSLPPEVLRAPEVVWAQEESRNRGAWTFIQPRLSALFPGRTVWYAGRRASASPATGSLRAHKEEQAALVEAALFGKGDREI